MSRNLARTAAALLLVSASALPLAAQPEARKPEALSLFAQLWDRFAAPLVALFENDETDGRGGFDPDGLNSDGRSGWDPNGLDEDGRGGWDPNG